MTFTQSQTRRFSRSYKRLHTNQLNAAHIGMDEILANPEIGARKDGKLVDIYVHKILIVNQEFLIAYTFNREKKVLTWEAMAPRENFYRDLTH